MTSPRASTSSSTTILRGLPGAGDPAPWHACKSAMGDSSRKGVNPLVAVAASSAYTPHAPAIPTATSAAPHADFMLLASPAPRAWLRCAPAVLPQQPPMTVRGDAEAPVYARRSSPSHLGRAAVGHAVVFFQRGMPWRSFAISSTTLGWPADISVMMRSISAGPLPQLRRSRARRIRDRREPLSRRDAHHRDENCVSKRRSYRGRQGPHRATPSTQPALLRARSMGLDQHEISTAHLQGDRACSAKDARAPSGVRRPSGSISSPVGPMDQPPGGPVPLRAQAARRPGCSSARRPRGRRASGDCAYRRRCRSRRSRFRRRDSARGLTGPRRAVRRSSAPARRREAGQVQHRVHGAIAEHDLAPSSSGRSVHASSRAPPEVYRSPQGNDDAVAGQGAERSRIFARPFGFGSNRFPYEDCAEADS